MGNAPNRGRGTVGKSYGSTPADSPPPALEALPRRQRVRRSADGGIRAGRHADRGQTAGGQQCIQVGTALFGGVQPRSGVTRNATSAGPRGLAAAVTRSAFWDVGNSQTINTGGAGGEVTKDRSPDPRESRDGDARGDRHREAVDSPSGPEGNGGRSRGARRRGVILKSNASQFTTVSR